MVNSLIVPDAPSAVDNSAPAGSRILRARDNPFRVERVHTFRYRPDGVSWDGILDTVQQMCFRGAIVGPEGTGKTTFLEDLREHLHAEGRATRWLQLRRDTRHQARALVRETLRQASPCEILLVDGAEQIGPMTWRRLARRTRHHAGLLITMHRAGRLPTLLNCTTSPQLLEKMVHELAPAYFDALVPELPELFARQRGNLRLCIRELYDWVATVGVQPSGCFRHAL